MSNKGCDMTKNRLFCKSIHHFFVGNKSSKWHTTAQCFSKDQNIRNDLKIFKTPEFSSSSKACKNFISNAGTEQEVLDAALKYGISADQIANAMGGQNGYDIGSINTYIGGQGISTEKTPDVTLDIAQIPYFNAASNTSCSLPALLMKFLISSSEMF